MKRSFMLCLAIAMGNGLYYGTLWSKESVGIADLFVKLGGIVPSTSFEDILEYLVSQLPWLIIEALCCIEIYRCFCVASVYYFSRCAKRSRWYLRESGKTLGLICVLVAAECAACVAVYSLLGHPVDVDVAALILLLAESATRIFYCYSIIALMFIFSLHFTSEIGFFSDMLSRQLCCIW